MEWSWDGSIISLSESLSPNDSRTNVRAPTSSPPVSLSRTPTQSGLGFALSAAGDTHTALPAPPERAYLSTSAFAPTSASPSDAPSPSHPLATHANESTHQAQSHPLASFLLAEHALSPPASPTTSVTNSFPGSRSRLSSAPGAAVAGGDAARSRSSRRRTRPRSRTGSVSSTASTDGSAHGDRGGEASSEDDHHAGGLVMPSMHLGRAAEHPSSDDGHSVKLLVLGKSREDRRTLATLLAHDEDLRRTTSVGSVAATTDMSLSFLSMRPSERSASRERSPAGDGAAKETSLFEALAPSSGPITLHQLNKDGTDVGDLVAELTRPLERLEAKLNRSYPATTGLAQLVEAAGCGEFEACLFLFSSPPLASEIAVARPVSHVLPIMPVLVLPPSPTGRPQKTAALSQAVQEQLNTAGVRWLPALTLARSSAAGPGSPLYMLPHDLFVQHTVPPHIPTSVASSHTSSPPSEGAPTSLSSSQEFVAPAHASSTYTSAGSSIAGDLPHEHAPHATARSLSASSRAGSSSSRSSSPRGHRRHPSSSSLASSAATSTSLADLRRLQAVAHHPSAPGLLRARRARAFLEWRDVEVAASAAGAVQEAVCVPEEWGETELSEEEGGRTAGRRALDFSRRVAERRRALGRHASTATTSMPCGEDDDDGDVLVASDDDDEREGREGGASPHAGDPMTPRCAPRPLPSPRAHARDSYFPLPPSPLGSGDVLASSTHSGASAASNFLVLPSADPFHLPSLLHLVGLNLRLAVFAPNLATACEDKKGERETQRARSRWGWWRAAAVAGLVFAVGVAAGAVVAAAAAGDSAPSRGAYWMAPRAHS